MALIDIRTGQEITEEPSFYQINIEFPADKYSIEDIEKIANQLHVLLGNNKIYHSEPAITNIYDSETSAQVIS